MIVDNEFKESNRGRGRPTVYRETEYLYIHNGILRKEPNFLIALFLIPLIVIFMVFKEDNLDIKLKDISKMDSFTKSTLLVSLIIILFSTIILKKNKYKYNRYLNFENFTIDVKNTRREIHIDDYKKQRKRRVKIYF
ncbi:hypothetical protein [Tenacibaculum sp.]|uniref:hypothetical protein n=1 Tax=Tenacibaculum sp. TaxID=1906242 RepID=UPI003AA7E57A